MSCTWAPDHQHSGDLFFDEFGDILCDPSKGLLVIITTDLKSFAQCIAAEQRAQKIFSYIKHVFRYRNKRTMLALYRVILRLLLEYGAQFWSPIKWVDVVRLEKVQARAIKFVTLIRHKGYHMRLSDLGLFTLQKRRCFEDV